MKNKLYAIIAVVILTTVAGCKQPLMDSRVMDEDMDNLISTLKQGDSSGIDLTEIVRKASDYDSTTEKETYRLAKALWGNIEKAEIIKKTHVGLTYYYWVNFTKKDGKAVRIRTEYSSHMGSIDVYLKLVGEIK